MHKVDRCFFFFFYSETGVSQVMKSWSFLAPATEKTLRTTTNLHVKLRNNIIKFDLIFIVCKITLDVLLFQLSWLKPVEIEQKCAHACCLVCRLLITLCQCLWSPLFTPFIGYSGWWRSCRTLLFLLFWKILVSDSRFPFQHQFDAYNLLKDHSLSGRVTPKLACKPTRSPKCFIDSFISLFLLAAWSHSLVEREW